MTRIELKCHLGVGPEVSGEALVTDDNFSARYDLDRIEGIFSRPQHKLAGQSYVDKIMVFNTAKGLHQKWLESHSSTPVRLIGVGVSQLVDADTADTSHHELDDTVDAITNRFGTDKLSRGLSLLRDRKR